MRVVLVVMVLLLCACSSKTNVHLYAKYLTKEQTEQIVTTLDESQYVVEVNQQEFPADINDNAIVYAPSANSEERLSLLINVLTANGYSVSNASLLMANNHTFTSNNVGVFVVPQGTIVTRLEDQNFEFKLPTVNEYGAIDCLHATTLYLKGSNEFMLEVNEWNNAKEDYIQLFIDGMWKLTNNQQLELHSRDWPLPLTFKRELFEKYSPEGKSEGIKFSPITHKNLSSEQKLINCSYSISLAVE